MKNYIATLLIGAAALSLASCNNHKWTDSLDYTTGESTGSISISESTSGTTKPIDPSEITGDVVVNLENGLTVYESYDLEKHAIKLIFVGDKEYYFPDLNPEYVVNVKYDLFQNSGGYFQVNMLPTETPIVVYFPISEYIKGISFTVRWDSVNEKFETTHHDISYRPTIDVYSYYSDEPIRVRDEFLHFALTKHFGGEYSERDLLHIGNLTYECNSMQLTTMGRASNWIRFQSGKDDSSYVYYYMNSPDGSEESSLEIIVCPEFFSDCESTEQPTAVSDEAMEDIERYFHGLYDVKLSATVIFNGYFDMEALDRYTQKYETFRKKVTENYIATDIPNYPNGKN
jgi:hypothetical protein